jgi:hypothetical protein
MFQNRFREQAVSSPLPAANAFLLCPVASLPAANPAMVQYQVALYQWAFAEAEAVVRPSILERDLLGVWN